MPGAPHDPAIISSQLVRPESMQQKPPQTTQSTPQIVLPEPAPKISSRPAFPEMVRTIPTTSAGTSGPAPIEKDLSVTFKNFVNNEKERVKKKKADMVHRDRESKLRELKKFSESFSLKTAVPQDLVPILTKDKAKQNELLEKSKAKAAALNQPIMTPDLTPASSQAASIAKALPPDSFALKDPEKFKRQTSMLLQNFPKINNTNSIGQNVRRVQQDKNIPVRQPMPVAEQRTQ